MYRTDPNVNTDRNTLNKDNTNSDSNRGAHVSTGYSSTSNGTRRKKNVGALGLAPLPTNTSSLGLSPINPPQYPSNRATTRREGQILTMFHEEVLVIDVTEAKAEFGMYKIGQLQERASDLFGDTVSYMLETKNQIRGTEAQPFVDEFTLRQIQMYARQMLGTLEITGSRIGEVIYDPLSLPPEQLGFWQKLLGRR